jgi:hypothetical protein
MAEVTGVFGDQPIELNNAATESTLRELVAAMAVLSAKVGGKAKGTQDIEKELKKFQQAVKKNAEALQGLTEEEKKARENKKLLAKLDEDKKKADEAATKRTHTLSTGLGNLGRITQSVTLGMTNLMSSLANVGDSMSSAASSMNAIPVVGGVLAGVFGAVAESADKLNKSYQAAASVGATFGGSITTMVNSASAAGLTVDQFSSLIKNNSQGLMMFGGTVEQGAKRFAELGKEMRTSQVGKELLRMGYSTEQVNGGMAKYMGMISRTGAQQGMSTAQLAAGAGKYMKELDGLARLTGQSREALQAEQEARLADAQFNALIAGKKPEEIAMLQNFVSSFPKAQQGAVKEMLATGNITSEAGVKFNALYGDTASEIMKRGQEIKATGKVNQDALKQTYKNSVEEQKQFQKSGQFQTLSQYAMEEYGDMLVAGTEMAARDANAMEKIAEEQRAATEKANQAQQIEEFKQRLAETSNVFSQLLAQSGLLEHLEDAFDTLIGITMDYVVPAFQFIADNFGLISAIVIPLVAVFKLLEGALFAAKVVEGFRTIVAANAAAATAAQTAATAAQTGATVAQTTAATGASVGLAALAAKAWAVVAPILMAVAPFVAIAAVVGAAVYLFKKMGGDMKVLSDAFAYVGSLIKTSFQFAFRAILSLVNKIPGFRGDFDDNIKELDDSMAAEQEKREKLGDNMAKRMAENRAKAAAEEEAERRANMSDAQKDREQRTRTRLEAREAAKADKEKAAEAKKAAEADKAKTEAAQGIPSGVGSGDPMKDMMLYNKRRAESAAGGAGAAGGAAGTGLGSLAARYESGGKGSEAVGYDSTGGTSFGKYQIATKTGTMDQFMKFLQKDNPEAYERLMSAGPADSGKDGKFAQEWKSLAKEGKLGDSEHKFIKATHYDKAMTGLGDATLQEMISKSGALQEVMWSTSVQHGAGGAKKIFESAFQKGMSEEELIKAVYASRAKKFGSSTTQVQASVQARFVDEQSRALAMVGTPSMATPNGAQAVAATTNPPAKAAETTAAPAAAPSRPASPGKSQESAETLLAQLNMQVGELIALTRDTQRINQRQLGVMAENGSNLYAMGA